MLKKLINKLRSFVQPSREKTIHNYKIHPTAHLYNKENIQLHSSTLVAEFVIIRAPIAKVSVEGDTHIGPFSVLLSGEHGIYISKNVMIGPHCVLAAGNHEFRNLELPMIKAGSFSNGPIVIEEDVWIGANCTITDNVRIGRGAIVGANSLVNKNIDPYAIVGGVPARFISSRLDLNK